MRITARLIIHCILPVDGIDGEEHIVQRHQQASNKLQAECRSGYCPEYAEAQRLL